MGSNTRIMGSNTSTLCDRENVKTRDNQKNLSISKILLTKERRDSILVHMYNNTVHFNSNLATNLIKSTAYDNAENNPYLSDIIAQCIRMNNEEALKCVIEEWKPFSGVKNKLYNPLKFVQYYTKCNDDMLKTALFNSRIHPSYSKNNEYLDLEFKVSIVKTWDVIIERNEALATFFFDNVLRDIVRYTNMDKMVSAMLGSKRFDIAQSGYTFVTHTDHRILDSHICDFLEYKKREIDHLQEHKHTYNIPHAVDKPWAHFIINTHTYMQEHNDKVPNTVLETIASRPSQKIADLLVLLMNEYPKTDLRDVVENRPLIIGYLDSQTYQAWIDDGRIKNIPRDVVISCLCSGNNELFEYVWDQVKDSFRLRAPDIWYMLRYMYNKDTEKYNAFQSQLAKVIDASGYSESLCVDWYGTNALDFCHACKSYDMFQVLMERNLVPEITMDFMKELFVTHYSYPLWDEQMLQYIYFWVQNKSKTMTSSQADVINILKSIQKRLQIAQSNRYTNNQRSSKFEWEP